MEACWANVSGGCEGGISEEHLISEGLWLGGSVNVKGAPWCKGGIKTIRKEKLTANILCVKHNSELSPVDVGGIKAFETCREFARLNQVRVDIQRQRKKRTRFTLHQHQIEGKLLERWLLKTLINMEMSVRKGERVGRHEGQGRLDPALVEIAFGRRNFEGMAGLYAEAAVESTLDFEERVQYGSCIDTNGVPEFVRAGEFLFYGFRLRLSLDPTFPPLFPDDNGNDKNLMRHINHFELKIGPHSSQRLILKW